MFKHYNYLGFHNPYYFTLDGSFFIEKDFPSIYNAFSGVKQIDIAAVLQVLNRNYILGDRTIVKGIQKTPWMARPDDLNRKWELSAVPQHMERIFSDEEIAEKLFVLIQKEMLEYIGESRHVGILLSGGMDSRIVAGTLDYLIKTRQLQDIKVTALTWGINNSRDVVYAKQIAHSLGWKWKHYTVGPAELRDNIEVAAFYGCEVSPIHFHAMPQIKEEKGLDCILAGSFGDSIGRGEYSGKKVSNLKNLTDNFKNVENLLRSNIYKNYSKQPIIDVKAYHRIFPQSKPYQQYEQDYQLHYMRRMLNSCMAVINEKIPLYQVFTKPDVFGFMWSLHPKQRHDGIYKIMLNFLNTDLKYIPWARTGLPYGATNGKPDNYLKKHHDYAIYISRKLLPEIKEIIYSGKLLNLGIFNHSAISAIFKTLAFLPKENNIYLGEKIIWLAALSRTLDMYDITNTIKADYHISDYFNGALAVPAKYIIKDVKRSIKNV